MPHHRAGATAVWLLLMPCAPLAQTSTQVWANVTFDWVKSEARYVWNRWRNTIDEPFTSTDHAIDLTMKRVW
jgi:hypothetical protein